MREGLNLKKLLPIERIYWQYGQEKGGLTQQIIWELLSAIQTYRTLDDEGKLRPDIEPPTPSTQPKDL
jgi:hypothetical protein